MTMNELAKRVAQSEGRKSQAKIGDIREILKILSVMLVMDEQVEKVLMKNGQRIMNGKLKTGIVGRGQ